MFTAFTGGHNVPNAWSISQNRESPHLTFALMAIVPR